MVDAGAFILFNIDVFSPTFPKDFFHKKNEVLINSGFKIGFGELMSFISMAENTAASIVASRIDISSSASNLITDKINKRKTRHIYSEIVRHTAAISFDHWKPITSSNVHRPCLGYADAGNIGRGSIGNNLTGDDSNFKYKRKRKKRK